MVHKRPMLVTHIVLLLLAAITLYPMTFMLVNAVKSGLQTTANPFAVSLHPLWGNFVQAFEAIQDAYLRTIFIVGVSVIGILFFALLSAYAFARIHFPGKTMLFYLVFGLLLVPGFLVLIPLFLEVKDLGLYGSLWGLILPYIAGGQAFCVFVLRTFVKSLPEELFEAALMDGATHMQMFLRLVVPLSMPVVITVGLLQIVGLWGDYVFPTLILHSASPTLAMAIANFQPPPHTLVLNAFNLQLAAFTLASIPIALLFVFLMRYFVAGITNGALKL